MKRSLDKMAKEAFRISLEVGKELATLMVPFKPSSKPKWCQCNKCGGWHYMAK